MKNILTVIFFLSFVQAKSQSPTWGWARTASEGTFTGGGPEGANVATDAQGNVFFLPVCSLIRI